MGINEIIMYIMMIFMLIAAVDRIFTQFGGSEQILGKVGLGSLGKSISGSGGAIRRRLYGNGRIGLGDGRYDRAGTSFSLLAWANHYSYL